MTPIELVVAGLTLAGSVAAGTVAHELSHALSLGLFGHGYEVRFHPARTGADGRLSGALATVVPDQPDTADGTAALRLSALMPLTLAAPLTLVPLGVVPDPFATGNLAAQLALVGWLACALPSPQDFSVAWYAERLLDESGDPSE